MILLTTDTCMPCKMVKAKLDELKIDYKVVDAFSDEGLELCEDWGVRGVPAMLTGDMAVIGLQDILKTVETIIKE